MVDGIAGVDILAALLGTEPCATLEPIEPWTPRPMPADRELLGAEMRRRTRAALDLVRDARCANRAAWGATSARAPPR